jgi:hypothetical protein
MMPRPPKSDSGKAWGVWDLGVQLTLALLHSCPPQMLVDPRAQKHLFPTSNAFLPTIGRRGREKSCPDYPRCGQLVSGKGSPVKSQVPSLQLPTSKTILFLTMSLVQFSAAC